MKPKIIYINYGIACRIKNKIYMNNKLKKDKELHKKILQHELEHSSGYVLKDILMDLNNKHLRNLKRRYYLFILKNPSTWIEFLPFWKYDNRIVFSPIMALAWLFSCLIALLIIYFNS